MFIARLKALLRRGPATAIDVIEVGSLTIDRRCLTCTLRDGLPIDLTPREFTVLEHLARRSPEVVPKQLLIDAVWGFDFDGDPNIVEVYVGYLRKKLGRDAVRTVRNVGYRSLETPRDQVGSLPVDSSRGHVGPNIANRHDK